LRSEFETAEIDLLIEEISPAGDDPDDEIPSGEAGIRFSP
jgi:hypothetical protein